MIEQGELCTEIQQGPGADHTQLLQWHRLLCTSEHSRGLHTLTPYRERMQAHHGTDADSCGSPHPGLLFKHGRYSLTSTLPGHQAQRRTDGLQWGSRYASRSDCFSPAQLHGTELAANPGCCQLNDAAVKLCRGLLDAAWQGRTFTNALLRTRSGSCRSQHLSCLLCLLPWKGIAGLLHACSWTW